MAEMLARTGTVTLNGSGTGTLSFGPGKYRETWKITRLTTDGNSAIEPTLDVYRGAAGSNLLDTTRKANGDISETDLTINSGERITAVYSGGTAGAVMTFYLEGTINYGI